MFQQLWKRCIKWDEKLPPDLAQLWEEWCRELPQLPDIVVPRCYFSGTTGQHDMEIQLHCYSDASEKAYGAAIYLRCCYPEGDVKTVLVASKSRVTPLKNAGLTLPRLELLGAVLGVKLSTFVHNIVKKKFNVKNFFWTDSMIVLYWIKGTAHHWKPFIQNRVNEILSKSDPNCWFHCPGQCNPADLLSRGCKLQKMQNCDLWWAGPKWLPKDPSEWPIVDVTECDSDPTIEGEKRKAFKTIVQISCAENLGQIKAVLNIENFSSLTKIVRVTAWIKRFISNMRGKQNKTSGPLTADEIQAAEIYWISVTQRENFGSEIECLENGKFIPEGSALKEFNPFLDEQGVLRVRGRLQFSNFSRDQKHPILIPNKSKFTDLLIAKNHAKIGHSGIAETLNQIRDKYWIIKGRQRVKSLINKCILCKRFAAKPLTQETAPLPAERISESPPFQVSGADFAGPLYIKEQTKGSTKAYIALFTCAVTRAIHLELVSNLSAETFLLAFRRFVGRRGMCKLLYTDNAKTFKKSEKDLKEIWNNLKEETLKDYFGENGVTWKYIVELSCWWGGFYERMVKGVKTCLRKLLGRASLNYEELETVLVEVEAILNSRPLTYMYSEVNEPSPLSPGHFLVGNRLTSLPPSAINAENAKSTKQELMKRIKYRQNLLDRFWKMWREQYVLDLRSAHKQDAQKATTIKENQIVLICDNQKPRQLWRMGVISETHVGRDGKVRACSVRLPNQKTIRRPVQLLCPMELEL